MSGLRIGLIWAIWLGLAGARLAVRRRPGWFRSVLGLAAGGTFCAAVGSTAAQLPTVVGFGFCALALAVIVLLVVFAHRIEREQDERRGLGREIAADIPGAADRAWTAVDSEIRRGHLIGALAMAREFWSLDREEGRSLLRGRCSTLGVVVPDWF